MSGGGLPDSRDIGISLSFSLLMQGAGAASLGVRRLSAFLPRIAAMGWPELIPAAPRPLAWLAEVAAALRARGPLLWVAGSPADVRALRALNGEPAGLCWVCCPADVPAGPLTAQTTLLLLEGPGWADRLAEAVEAAGGAVAVASGRADAPPGGWWVKDRTVGTPQAALGPASLLVAAWAGADLEEVCAAAASVDARCQRVALYENPALLWGATLAAWVQGGGGQPSRPLLCHLWTLPEAAPLAELAAAMQARSLRRPATAERPALEVVGECGVAGDPDRLEALHVEARAVTLWAARHAAPVDPAGVSGPVIADPLEQDLQQHLLGRRRGMLVVRLSGLDRAAGRAAAIRLIQLSAVVADHLTR